jgi:hypothetical protein
MIGEGGKYDDLCEATLRAAQAQGVILIVMGGFRGSGFSVSIEQTVVAKGGVDNLPKVLREVADQIDAELKELKKS